MAQFDDDTPPAGYRYVTSAMPGGGSVRYLEPVADRSVPQATPEGQFIPTPPSVDQMRYELMRQAEQKTLPEFLANLPTEMLNQAVGIGETGATLLGGLVSPIAAAAAGVGKNIYDYFDKGQIDPKATKEFANEAARLFSYVPVTPAGQSIVEAIGEAPAQIMGTGQGLPPIVSGINPRAMQTGPVLGPLSAGVKRDISQFSNDVFNAQRGITPGYATLGSEFSDAFVTPRPTTYEMLAGLEPSRIPSTASAAVKPVGKGTTLYDLFEPFPAVANPSGMTSNLAQTYKPVYEGVLTNKHKAGPALDKYADAIRRVNPDFEGRFLNSLEKYVAEKVGLVPENQKPYQLQLVEQVNNFANDWNAANPTSKIPTFDQFLAANAAYNQWLLGPNKNYMERQMGTGATTDPVLAEIEKTGLSLFPDTPYSERALSRRERAKEIHAANPELPLGNIGQQTAKTEAGKQYEDITDSYIKTRTRSEVYDELGIPAETRPRFDAMRPYEPIYDVASQTTNPILPFQDKLYSALLKGEIKPENVTNVSMQRLVTMLDKDEQDRIKALGKDKDAYAKYKKAFLDKVPTSMVDKTTESGAKFIRFDKNSPLSREDTVRALCMDTKDLNHCLAQGAHNVGDYKGYAPLVEPHTGKRPKGVPTTATSTSYIDSLFQGGLSIVSYRGPDGTPIATIQENPLPNGRVNIEQIMSTGDKKIVDPAHAKEVRQWLNANADRIKNVDSTYGLGHVGSPFDLYRSNAMEAITTKHQNIDPRALEELADRANFENMMNLDYDFAQWYKKNTGEDIDLIAEGEPFSNMVEAYGMGTSDLLEQIKDRLGPELARSPEFIKFINDAIREDDLEGGGIKDIARAIGRFSTIKEIQDYAKSEGIDLNYPEIDIATASKDDLNKYADRLDREIRAMVNSDEVSDNIDAVRQRLDEVTARMNELHRQEVQKIRDATKDILETVPTDIMARLGGIERMPAAWRGLLRDSVEGARLHNVLGLEDADALFAKYSGPLRDQIEILYGPVESNVLTTEQSNTILAYLMQDRVDGVLNMLKDAKGVFNPSNNSTIQQAKQAAQIVANWAKYRLENPELTNYGQQPRTEIVEQPNANPQPRAPEMNWTFANYLRDVWQVYDRSGYDAAIHGVQTGRQAIVNALLGNQAPGARLPRDVHWSIVRELANPDRNDADIADLHQLIFNREGIYGPLTPNQSANAMGIIHDWANANGIDLTPRDAAVNPLLAIPNMNRERAAALNSIVDEFLNTRVLENVPPDMEGAIYALVGNQAPAAILPQAAHRHIVALLVHPNTTMDELVHLYSQIRYQEGQFSDLTPTQRANALDMLETWADQNGIDRRREFGMAAGGQVRRMADGGPVKMQDGGVLNTVYNNLIPAHIRTYAETMFGNRSPITERNFSGSELDMMRDAIAASRRDRTITNSRLHQEQLDKAASAEERMALHGRGPSKELDQTVGYQHYPNSGDQSVRDDNAIGYDAAIRNTLGRFAYTKDAAGNLIATDLYKFRDDLPGQTRPTADYANMTTMEKLGALIGDSAPSKAGLGTLLSRAGSAFLDPEGRPVTVNLGKAPFAEGGAVTDTLDKMVKNPQASTLLNLDLPNLVAAKQQTRPLKRGGKVEFSNKLDDMRYALTRR